MERFTVGDYIFTTILEAVPSPVFIVDDDVRIHGYNMAAAPLLDKEPGKILRMGCGDALHCIHSLDSPEGCGGGQACKKCVIRNSVSQSYQGDKFVREKCEMQLVKGNKTEQIQTLITTAPVNYQDETFVLVILEDVTEIEALRSILPICVNCKKIRDDKNYWQKVESYLSKYLDIKFSHSVCPECLKILYPDLKIHNEKA
jgi:PAS domain-containing protein